MNYSNLVERNHRIDIGRDDYPLCRIEECNGFEITSASQSFDADTDKSLLLMRSEGEMEILLAIEIAIVNDLPSAVARICGSADDAITAGK